jgi:hypothetical protein
LFRDGIRESGVVTKIFDVDVVETNHSPTEETENRFIYELQQERKVDFIN